MIDNKGNFRTADLSELTYFQKQNKNMFYTATYRAYKNDSPKALYAFYNYVLVPIFVRLYKNTGLYLLPTDAELRMRESQKIMLHQEYDIDKDKWISRLLTFGELDYRDKILYIQFLKMQAAEDFNYSINDQLTWKLRKQNMNVEKR